MRLLILTNLIAIVASRCFIADDFKDKLKPGDSAVSFDTFNHDGAKKQCANIDGKLIIADTKEKIDAVLKCGNRYSSYPNTWIDGHLIDTQLQWSNGRNISNSLLCPGEVDAILLLKSQKDFVQANIGVRIYSAYMLQPCLQTGDKSGKYYQYACEFKKTR